MGVSERDRREGGGVRGAVCNQRRERESNARLFLALLIPLLDSYILNKSLNHIPTAKFIIN